MKYPMRDNVTRTGKRLVKGLRVLNNTGDMWK